MVWVAFLFQIITSDTKQRVYINLSHEHECKSDKIKKKPKAEIKFNPIVYDGEAFFYKLIEMRFLSNPVGA